MKFELSFNTSCKTYMYAWSLYHTCLTILASIAPPPTHPPTQCKPACRPAAGILLAVASSSGWLHVYQAVQSGQYSWQPVHSDASFGPVAGLAFNPLGDCLGVAYGSTEGHDLRSVQSLMNQVGWRWCCCGCCCWWWLSVAPAAA